jgi:hypothetical protein
LSSPISSVRVVVVASNQTQSGFDAVRRRMRQMVNDARVSANRMVNQFAARGGIAGAIGRQSNRVSAMMGRMANTVGRTFAGLTTVVGENAKAMGITIGASMAPALVAALNAGVLAAVGGGVLAGGIALAAKDPRVAEAFKGMGSRILDDLENMASIFVTPLIRSAGILEKAWRTAVGPGVRMAFQDILKVVEPLAHGIAGLASNAMPGFNKAVQASVPILMKLAQFLPKIGTAMSDMFSDMSEGGEGAMKGLVIILAVVIGSLKMLGKTLEYASKYLDFITDAAEKVYTALAKIPFLGAPFKLLAEMIGAVNDEAAKSGDVVGQLTLNYGEVAQATERARSETRKLNTEMDELFGRMTGSMDAALAYEEAIDAMTESIKENGRSLDITNEKGRENVRGLEEIARAAYATRQAAIEMAGGENASAAAVDAANAKFRQQIDALRDMLYRLGLNKAQVDSLLASWYALANAPNMTKRVDIVYRRSGDIPRDQRVGSGNIVGYASGGSVKRDLAVVGERGWELADFKTGRVMDHGASQRMLSDIVGQRGGNQPVAVQPFIGQGAGQAIADILNMLVNRNIIRWKTVNDRIKVA